MKKKDPVLVLNGIEERVTRLETNVSWIIKSLEKLDKRLWYIVTAIIINILLAILLKLI
jgi:hypothetical protein